MTVDYKTAQGWLRAEEREYLMTAANTVVPSDGVILNIGVEYGASVACLRAGNPSARIIALDIDISKLNKDVYLECQPLLIEKDSSTPEAFAAVAEWAKWQHKAALINLLFVDGDHTYEGVLADARYASYFCASGMHVCFHDCYDFDNPERKTPNPNCPDVNKAVSEWVKWVMWEHDDEVQWVELEPVGTMRIFKRG